MLESNQWLSCKLPDEYQNSPREYDVLIAPWRHKTRRSSRWTTKLQLLEHETKMAQRRHLANKALRITPGENAIIP